MRHRKPALRGLAVIAAVALAVAGPAIAFHPSPSSAQQPAVVVVEMTKILPNGNTQVTEQKFVNKALVKEEITVTNPQGQLVSKIETVFNAAGQIVKQETVTVMNGTVTKVEEKFVNGMVVKREVETVTGEAAAAENHDGDGGGDGGHDGGGGGDGGHDGGGGGDGGHDGGGGGGDGGGDGGHH